MQHLAGQYPLAGMGWQALHYVLGLARLGHDVYYVEDSGAPPYDPRVSSVVETCDYGVEFLRRTMEAFDLGDRWAYVDVARGQCHGLSQARVDRLYRESDALVNVCGATRLREEHLACPIRVYVQSDPVHDQILVAQGNPGTLTALEAHTHLFTYGENLGHADCPVPMLKFHWRPTRPPVLMDCWAGAAAAEGAYFTTIATWQNASKDITFAGQHYYWSKHVNFLAFADLPALTPQPLEVALHAAPPGTHAMLREKGWHVVSALDRSRDVLPYREHILASRGEFTVAKDLMARPRSGWFSDRSVCYLAAGRPVVTQDTGFGKFVPTGAGLFAVATPEAAAAAIDTINGDYRRHADAARAVAAECFAAEVVLGALCREADL